MKLRSIAAIAFATTLSLGVEASIAQQEPPRALSGTYQIGGEVIPEPPTSKTLNSHVRIYLTGRTAADFFASMPVKAKKDECFDDGTMTKAVGDLICSRSPKGKHECWFGIEFKSAKVVPGFVC